jgi:hypothetical protein
MTVDELADQTKNLEETLHYLIENFEDLYDARVAEVQTLEPYHDREDETSRNQEVRVRLDPLPHGFPKKEKKILERRLRKLLRSYEKETSCRVTEVLVRQGYPVEVRVDLLAYPQRLLRERRKALGEHIEGLLDSFEQDTQGRIAEILVEEGEEGYIVKVRLAPSAPE